MNLTNHAREQMRRRNISKYQVRRALERGRESWRAGALLVVHGDLRIIFDPYVSVVITAYWKRSGRTYVDKVRRRKESEAA